MEKNIITLGMYPQNMGLAKETIEWIVLKRKITVVYVSVNIY